MRCSALWLAYLTFWSECFRPGTAKPSCVSPTPLCTAEASYSTVLSATGQTEIYGWILIGSISVGSIMGFGFRISSSWATQQRRRDRQTQTSEERLAKDGKRLWQKSAKPLPPSA